MEHLFELSIDEKDALRLYEGDVRLRDAASKKIISKISKDSIWGDRTAYKTLNALMFEGTENEEIRILKEGSKLNTHFITNIDITIRILSNIYMAMCKYGILQTQNTVAYRVERNSSMKNLKGGTTISCFSASKRGFQKDFTYKLEIVLIELIVKSGVPFIDYKEALKGEYYLPEEEEILLPPFVAVIVEEVPLSMKELKIKDMNGERPKAKYRVFAENSKEASHLTEEEIKKKDELYTLVTNEETLGNAQKYIINMNQNSQVEEENKIQYCVWKENYQKYMKYVFREIESNIVSRKEEVNSPYCEVVK